METMRRAERGQIDADLGGGLLEQRIGTARSGQVRWLLHDHPVSPRAPRIFRLWLSEERALALEVFKYIAVIDFVEQRKPN
jgi:hypothetical protein